MKIREITKTNLLAPCGMNCAVCIGYQREKKKCGGCRATDNSQPKHCQRCSYRHCAELETGGFTYCYECLKFPCPQLRAFDRRYRKWDIRLIENLKSIRSLGEEQFLRQEAEKWACSCGEILCAHEPLCLKCGADKKKHEPPMK